MHKVVLAMLAAVVGLCALAGCEAKDAAEDEPAASSGQQADAPNESAPQEWEVRLMEGYPEDAVPLYESNLLDTTYYSVRNDPQWASVEGGLRNIYHVVYQTDVAPSEVLDYYRGLLDTVDESVTMDMQLGGTIGEYTIWLNTSEQGSYNAVYLSVDLPKKDVTEVNPFFDDYPEAIVEAPESFVFFEEMFYNTLYRSTDMSYVRHFDIADRDGDGNVDLSEDECYTYFESLYGTKEGFAISRDSRTVSWKDGKYSVMVAYMSGHHRGNIIVGMDYEPPAE